MLNLSLTNIFNNGRIIYLFHRPNKELEIMKVVDYFPYYFEPDPKGIYKGYNEKKLIKIFCKQPYEVKNNRSAQSYLGDVIFTKSFLIDRIDIEKTNLKCLFLDVEMQTTVLPNPQNPIQPISCITTYDNYTQEYKTFYLPDFKNEKDLLFHFMNYIKQIKSDIIIGWNMINFDYPYLCNRIKEKCGIDFPSYISPISEKIKHNNFPAGISIIDLMEWVKKIYRYKKYSLDNVYAETFNVKLALNKPDFSQISEEVKEKNKVDVMRMVEIENKLKLINYFDELRIISKVLWEDLVWNNRLVDNVLLQVAKEYGIILPTKPEYKTEEDEESIKGAYVYCKTGLFEGVKLFDITGTYPNLIITFCLDPANKTYSCSQDTIQIKKVNIKQDYKALTPTACIKLMEKRKPIQEKLKTLDVKDPDYDLLKKRDEALKSLINSFYGIMLFKNGRLFDKDIASTITFLARFLIRYCKYCLYKYGYNVIYADTDSLSIQSPIKQETIQELLNTEIIPKWLSKYGKIDEGRIKFKYEKTFDKLFIITKKHYFGITSEGKEIKKGIEGIRSDSSKFQEEFQENLLRKIMNKESKENIIGWINDLIKNFKNNQLINVSFPCKISKPLNEYKVKSIHIRALEYAQKINPDFIKGVGETYYYTFITPNQVETYKAKRKSTKKIEGNIIFEVTVKEVELKRNIDVMAFDEYNYKEIKEVDWDRLLERNIYFKIQPIFDAMSWKMEDIK